MRPSHGDIAVTRLAVRQGGWTYRLDRDAGRDAWLLRSEDIAGGADLYEFTLEPQRRVDYVVYNHYTGESYGSCHQPQSKLTL